MKRYKKAQTNKAVYSTDYVVPQGHSVCIAGYLDCPVGPTDHYHCANCGGISGHQGHYSKLPLQTEWQFNCPDQDG